VPYNYHFYQVNKPVVVIGGPVASWFGQLGFGTQFQLPRTVGGLLRDGMLEEIVVEEKCNHLTNSGQEWMWTPKGGTLSLATGVLSKSEHPAKLLIGRHADPATLPLVQTVYFI
jgi:hypothetical protein